MPDLESDLRKLTTDARQMAEENARLRKINSQKISVLKYVLPLLQQVFPATVDLAKGLHFAKNRTGIQNTAMAARCGGVVIHE